MREYSYTTTKKESLPGGVTKTTYETTTHGTERVGRTFARRSDATTGYTSKTSYTNSSSSGPIEYSTKTYQLTPRTFNFQYYSGLSAPVTRTGTRYGTRSQSPTSGYRSGGGSYSLSPGPTSASATVKSNRIYYDSVSSLDRNNNAKLDRISQLSKYESDGDPCHGVGCYGSAYMPQSRTRSVWKYDYHSRYNKYRNEKVESKICPKYKQ